MPGDRFAYSNCDSVALAIAEEAKASRFDECQYQEKEKWGICKDKKTATSVNEDGAS